MFVRALFRSGEFHAQRILNIADVKPQPRLPTFAATGLTAVVFDTQTLGYTLTA